MMMFKPVRCSSAYTEMMPGIAGRTLSSSSTLYKPSMISPTSSWVDLSRESEGTPPTPVPFCTTSDYLVMLREAQRETSAHSSNRVSPIYSLRSSPPHSSTPKSPPNSPNTELAALEDKLSLHGVFINRDPEMEVMETLSDISGSSLHTDVWRMPRNKYKKRTDWSKKEVIVTLVLTHMLAVGLGISLGFWVLRRKG